MPFRSGHRASASAVAMTAAPISQFVFRTRLILICSLCFAHHEVIAPVLLPAAFVVVLAKWKLFGVADRRHSALVDSERCQVILAGLCALGAQRDIVLLRSALIAITLDLHPGLRMRLEPACVGLQHGTVLITDGVIVVPEMNVTERTAFPDSPVLPVVGLGTAGA